MAKHTRLSAKGQVVIPKDVRDRLHWEVGTELEVIEGPSGVMLRARPPERKKLTMDEAVVQLRAIVNYKGPVYSDKEATAAIDEMFRNDPQRGQSKR